MSALAVQRSKVAPDTPDEHVILIVRADPPTGTSDEACDLVGILARVGLLAQDALDWTAREHRCRSQLFPDDEALAAGAEVVEADRFGGCRLFVSERRYDEHLQDSSGGLPWLIVHVPANRERAWTRHLEALISNVIDRDRRTLAGPPPDDDTEEP